MIIAICNFTLHIQPIGIRAIRCIYQADSELSSDVSILHIRSLLYCIGYRIDPIVYLTSKPIHVVYHMIQNDLNITSLVLNTPAVVWHMDLFCMVNMLHLYSQCLTYCIDSETEPNMPMPPPKQVATSLKKMAFDSVQEWRNKFGVAYKKLDLAYNYLKTCKKVCLIV